MQHRVPHREQILALTPFRGQGLSGEMLTEQTFLDILGQYI